MTLPTLTGTRVVAVGAAWSGIVLGGSLAWLHVAHNPDLPAFEALILGSFLVAFFGAAGGTACLVAATLMRVRDRSKASAGAGALRLGLFLVHAGFFLPVALYGLTYDQLPGLWPVSLAAMIAYLLTVALLVLIASWISATIAAALLTLRAARRRWLVLALLTVVLGCLLLPLLPRGGRQPIDAAAVPPLPDHRRSSARVALVGLDGADWRLIEPLMAQGLLPTFSQLCRDGLCAPLKTLPGANSAVIWASIYTGKTPSQHRVEDFYRIRLPGMRHGAFPVHRSGFQELAEQLEPFGLAHRRIADRSFLQARPIWEILDDLGISTGVVDGYFFSVPARPLRTPGSYLLSYALNSLAATPEWRPEDLSAEQLEVVAQPPAVLASFLPHRDLSDFHWQAATLLDLLRTRPQPRFLSLYTHEPDSLQHRRWRGWQPELYLSPEPPPTAEQRRELVDLHRDFDSFLGELRRRLHPETTLIVVSDHGHAPTIVHRLDTQHRHGPPGILMLSGPEIRSADGALEAHVYDVVPTLLRLFGLPPARDLPGHALRAALRLDEAPTAAPIPSYDAFGDDASDAQFDYTESELQKLRANGYIGF